VFVAYFATEQEQRLEESKEEAHLRDFKRMYKKVVYNSLNTLNKPYIFANSSFVDDKVSALTKESGFDGCFESKLTPQRMKIIVQEKIIPFAD